MPEKIIRSICSFNNVIDEKTIQKLNEIEEILSINNFTVQTKRICSPSYSFNDLSNHVKDENILLSLGKISYDNLALQIESFFKNPRVFCNLNLSQGDIDEKYTDLLFDIINQNPAQTFNLCLGFHLPVNSPFFPSSKFGKQGFSIGLQATDLSEGYKTLEDWFANMAKVWMEIDDMFKDNEDYLGIDSSIAPLFEGSSSFVHMLKQFGYDFSTSTTTDVYMKITDYIKEMNPRPIGLCGLMVPCLEDFELAREYEKGAFSIERNIFLSLHSGLGIDTYPIGIDEDPKRIIDILKTIQKFSQKYEKPLAVRFVSDGKTKIGQKSDFKNQYLKDITIRKL